LKLQIHKVKQALEEAHNFLDQKSAEILRLKAELVNAQVAHSSSSFPHTHTFYLFLDAFLALFWTCTPLCCLLSSTKLPSVVYSMHTDLKSLSE
jgi:hypothetical protein